jgi:hypothetical protein
VQVYDAAGLELRDLGATCDRSFRVGSC